MKQLITLFAVCLVALSLGAPTTYAKSKASCTKASNTASAPAIPDVTYPFTFKCQHCSMTITIKTPADWTKSCPACACGTNNLGCYKPGK